MMLQCPLCHELFNESRPLMEHVFRHVAGAPADAPQCRYCLAHFAAPADLAAHLQTQHPVDTKSPDLFTYACLICEVRFAAVLTLAAHMQKAHAPRELPYACACGHRTSAHRAALAHRDARHARSRDLHCPHCLKVIPVYADGHELTANVLIYIDHLKQHQDKELEVRCNRCVLRFVHLGQLKEHQIRDHHPVDDVIPLCSEEHLINKPKNKARPPVKDSTSHAISDTYEQTTLVLPDGLLCRECDTPLESDKHFLGRTRCSRCPFATSCYRGMLRHSGYCAGPFSLETAPRRAACRLHCVCGYRTDIGTDMLSHLLATNHTSAYTSEEDARANTVRDDSYAPKPSEEQAEPPVENMPAIPDYAPPSVINTQLSLDDLAPPSVLQSDQHDQELLKDAYDRPLATPRHEEQHYSLGDFEPLPQEPPPQPDFEQL
ncbi:unnamed protein product [Euphydryas editha]|uniref:C2H2-type domain-containing protein n=1 Tax=Euphydryas editha TaxID=104508 RepID=A0AAU9V1Y8_EUPED|nr:unnamed protein product [Euphydryas editha]